MSKQYYVNFDDNGNEILTEKGRGRTKLGYAEQEAGSGKFYPVEMDVNITCKQENNNYVLAKIVDGELLEQRPFTRGKRPKGFKKVLIHDGGNFTVEDDDEENCDDIKETSNILGIPVLEVESNNNTRVFEAQNKIKFKKLKECFSKSIVYENENSFKAQFVSISGIEEEEIDYIQFDKNLCTIRVDLNSDEIGMSVYSSTEEDVIIKKGLE